MQIAWHSNGHIVKFYQQTSKVVQKANGILSLINKSFEYIKKDTLPVLCKALVWPIIEYGNIVWSPFLTRILTELRVFRNVLPELSHP